MRQHERVTVADYGAKEVSRALHIGDNRRSSRISFPITLRPGDKRGRSRFDWLDSWDTFSFGDYYDPQNMSFSDLRVINEDRVAPGAGCPTHSHRDVENHHHRCGASRPEFLVAVLNPGQHVVYPFKPGRQPWLQLTRGDVSLDGIMLSAGGGAAVTKKPPWRLRLLRPSNSMYSILPDPSPGPPMAPS